MICVIHGSKAVYAIL